MNNQTQTTIAMILLAGVLAVGIFMGLTRVDQYLKIKAIDDCGNVARFQKEIPDEGITVYYPETNIYKTCLDDKGIK